jgi:SAM-dependent methyltransferase
MPLREEKLLPIQLKMQKEDYNMIEVQNKYKYELTEDVFNEVLPEYLKKASKVYFTPIPVAEMAVKWLTEDGEKRILDIGAGVGKFCIIGARNSDSYFYGIEYRPSLVKLAAQLIEKFEAKNISVFHANILQINFSTYDAFYLYNPFFENLFYRGKLNSEVMLSGELYDCYLRHTEAELDKAKPGTRLVTYHGNNFEIPDSYRKEKEDFNGNLKLWIRE